MTPQERLLANARAEIGYCEKSTNAQLEDKTANAGRNNWTKYAAMVDSLGVYNGAKNGYPWCDVFADWNFIVTFGIELAMAMTYQPMGGYGAGCTESARYYKQAGAFFTSDPQPGDQMFFSNDGGATMYHTALVEKVEGGRVYTIEGNTSADPGVVDNGGSVNDKSYPLDYWQIGGYGRPDWALVEETEEMANITQDEFNSMFKVAMAAYRAELQDNDCGNYSEEGRQFAIDTGLMVGGTPLEDGTPNYMWEDFMTREQLATVMHRFAKMAGFA